MPWLVRQRVDHFSFQKVGMRTAPLFICVVVFWLIGCGDNNGPTGATTGSIRVTVTTTGTPADPNGYTVSVDGGTGQAIEASGSTVTIPDVSAGQHTVALGDLADNCSTAAGTTNPQTATVAAGQTAQITFAVNCAGGSSPVITSLTFPATVSNDAGTIASGEIGYSDPDGDIVEGLAEEVSDPNNAFTVISPIDLSTIAVGTSGTFEFTGFQCSASAGAAGCPTGPVTLRLTLRDAAGNLSEPYTYSFEIVE